MGMMRMRAKMIWKAMGKRQVRSGGPLGGEDLSVSAFVSKNEEKRRVDVLACAVVDPVGY